MSYNFAEVFNFLGGDLEVFLFDLLDFWFVFGALTYLI